MMYNAIIREYTSAGGTVVGRLLLKDLKQIPISWVIEHRGIRVDGHSSLDHIMCSPEEPLQLTRPFPHVPHGVAINIRTPCLGSFNVPVSLEYTVKTVQVNAYYLLGSRVLGQPLSFHGIILEDSRTLKEYGIKDGDTLIFPGPQQTPRRSTGGYAGDFRTVDLEGEIEEVKTKGTVARKWEGYDIGLNLYGICPNEKCISKGNGNTPNREVVIQAKYGSIRMVRGQNKFLCPACQNTVTKKHVGMFTPNNFLVCFGRALFQFKKSGTLEPVKRVLMQSLGLRDQCSHFKGGEMSEYDFIEITTVAKDSSPYHCVGCNRGCWEQRRSKGSEIVLGCGHAYHMRCRPGPDGSRECAVCKSEFYDSILGFLHKVGEGSYDKRRKRFHYDVIMYGEDWTQLAELGVDEEEYERNLERLELEEEERLGNMKRKKMKK